MLRAEFASRTDAGVCRDSNEDDVVCSPELGLFLVADGMSGYGGGKLAAEIAAQTIAAHLHGAGARGAARREPLSKAIAEANLAVLHKAREQWPLYAGLATTLAILLVDGDRAHIAHVGIDRVYRLREGKLERLTRDHSLVNEVLDKKPDTSGEDLASLPRGIIMRALGIKEAVEPGYQSCELRAGDLFCLCTDGLHCMLSDDEIQRVLDEQGVDLERAADALVARAKSQGEARPEDDYAARDNLSVVLVRIAAD